MKKLIIIFTILTILTGDLFSQNNNFVSQDSLTKQKTFDSLYVLLIDKGKSLEYPSNALFEKAITEMETISTQLQTKGIMENKVKDVKCGYNTSLLRQYNSVLNQYDIDIKTGTVDKKDLIQIIEEYSDNVTNYGWFYQINCPTSGMDLMKKRLSGYRAKYGIKLKNNGKYFSMEATEPPKSECSTAQSLEKVINKLSINLGVLGDWTGVNIIDVIFRNQCNWIVESNFGIPHLRDIEAEAIVKNNTTGKCFLRDVDIQQGRYVIGEGFKGPLIMYYGKTGERPCLCPTK